MTTITIPPRERFTLDAGEKKPVRQFYKPTPQDFRRLRQAVKADGSQSFCRWTVFRGGKERQCMGRPNGLGFCSSHQHLAEDFSENDQALAQPGRKETL